MITADKSLTQEELDLLKSMQGQMLDSIDACIAARGDLALNTVRLHFGQTSIDLNDALGTAQIDELGTLEEIGFLSIVQATEATLNLSETGLETTAIPVGKIVKGITVANNRITVFNGQIPVAQILCTQAIIIQFEDEVLVLDREEWFSELIAIKAGSNATELLYNDSQNWEPEPEDDSPYRYEYITEIVTL